MNRDRRLSILRESFIRSRIFWRDFSVRSMGVLKIPYMFVFIVLANAKSISGSDKKNVCRLPIYIMDI